MPKPDVSIIVPVYNVEKYLSRCITSLRNQTLKNIEIILVDDASRDSSSKICDDAAMEDKRIKVIHKVNEGAGMARNTGLEVANGKYIGFVDSDDYVEECMFETLYNKAEEYGSDLVMSGVIFVDGNMFLKDGECVLKSYFDKDTHFITQSQLKELKMGIVGSLPEDIDDSKYGMSIWKNIFKAEIIKNNNITFKSEREVLSEDALFMIDYISNIKKATGINEAFYNYCRNEDSISKSYKKDRLEKSLAFVKEVENRFKKDCTFEEYKMYIYRFWQAMCRVICSQEIMYGAENDIKYKDLKKILKNICINKLTEMALKTYPIGKLPLKQRIFAYGMKYRIYFVLKVLVGLRNR